MTTNPTKLTKTKRLLISFAAVELKPEHINHGDQGPTLRDYGVAGSVATALIRWGEMHTLTCWFENARGKTPNAHSWQTAFLRDAAKKHVELFGKVGVADLSKELLSLALE